MTYAITQSCCKDASCVSVCPVDCIHPTPEEPDFATAEILYIDPKVCIDCGACADACPAKAIQPTDLLSGREDVFTALNAEFYATHENLHGPSIHTFDDLGTEPDRTLRVAVVGTGPSASYAARALLTSTDADVTILDRSPVPGGLVRLGIAPDHKRTKHIGRVFEWAYRHPRTRMFMNVEVGRDLTHEELLKHHDAVIYGVGANRDRRLGVPGEDLAGVYGAPIVHGWYNGDLTVEPDAVQFDTDRVVVVGNGNVALDIARLLLSDPRQLRTTDMADHAIDHIARGRIREVVLLGRRGPEHAAFTRPELLTMPEGIEMVVAADTATEASFADPAAAPKLKLLAELPREEIDWSTPPPEGRRVVLAFNRQVTQVEGDAHVEALTIAPTTGSAGTARVPCGALVRSTGHYGSPVPGLPFDEATGTIPNDHGRVVDPSTGEPVPGAYVVGWIKRGAHGGVGVNRPDAHETVVSITNDASAGRLRRPKLPAAAFPLFLRRRVPALVSRRRMLRIDAAEVDRGLREGRPRRKYTSREEMLAHR